MMKEAESHAEEDRKKKDEVEAHNLADQAVYAAERMLTDSGDKLSDDARGPIESAIAEVKTAREGTDVAAINAALEQLNAAQHKAAEELYKQAGETPPTADQAPTGEAPAGEAADSSGDGEDVIDAEVVEDDKK